MIYNKYIGNNNLFYNMSPRFTVFLQQKERVTLGFFFKYPFAFLKFDNMRFWIKTQWYPLGFLSRIAVYCEVLEQN